MSNFLKAAIASLLIALAACGGGSKPAPATPTVAQNEAPTSAEPATEAPPAPPPAASAAREIIDIIAGYRDQLCACADAACADGVQQAMMTWMMKSAEQYADAKASADEEAEVRTIMEEMQECAARFASPTAATP